MKYRPSQQRFETLLHQHRGAAFKVAGLHSRSAADRYDLVQEISIRLSPLPYAGWNIQAHSCAMF